MKKVLMMVFFLFYSSIVYAFSYDSGHRDFAPSGAKIRLEISEEECQQYSNRYYFRNLCILCPDEQPMVDGHCQRCPGNQFVISNGCRDCDDDNNYITTKAECEACPNRVYEGELCKLVYKNKKWCWDSYPWKGTKEECDACENRRYTTEGLCEVYYQGWDLGGPQPDINGIRKDIYYENNQPVAERYFDKNNHLIREEYFKEKPIDVKGVTGTHRDIIRYSTYFKSGKLRTQKDLDFMKGYYEDGNLAFKREGDDSFLYTPNGDILAHIILRKAAQNEKCMIWDGVSEYVIEKIMVNTKDGSKQMSEPELFSYLQKNYPIDFELPFVFRTPKGKSFECKVINSDTEKKYDPNF